MTHDQDQLVTEASREMMFVSQDYLTLTLSAEGALTLLGSLQFVLRHPLVGDQARAQMRMLADTIEDQLASLGPATAELCAAGWDPKRDPEAA